MDINTVSSVVDLTINTLATVGGGAVLIDILQKYSVKSAYAFDINIDLINCYNVIKTNLHIFFTNISIFPPSNTSH